MDNERETIKMKLYERIDRRALLNDTKNIRELTFQEDLELRQLNVEIMNLWSELKD